MKCKLLIFGFIFCSAFLFSQKTTTNIPLSYTLKIDLCNRYLWRGQSWGGNYPVLQPSFEYKFKNSNWSIATWLSSNFKDNYFYEDGENSSIGYQEADFIVNYELTDYLKISVADYFWPTVEKIDGIDNNYFNYGINGVKSVDASVNFDFTEENDDGKPKYRLPVLFTLSTLIQGNDFMVDYFGNKKRNFTTYAEVSYYESKYKKIAEFTSTLGCVFNNKAGYYTHASYTKHSFTNLSLKAEKTFEINKISSIPVNITYIHNTSNENTDFYGKNFIVFGISYFLEK